MEDRVNGNTNTRSTQILVNFEYVRLLRYIFANDQEHYVIWLLVCDRIFRKEYHMFRLDLHPDSEADKSTLFQIE